MKSRSCVLVMAFAALSCQRGGAADSVAQTDVPEFPPDVLETADPGPPWTGWASAEPPPLPGPFFASHPEPFRRMSRYATHVVGPDRPDVGHRGAFGTGNGHVFGFVGLSDPLNTLHSLVGPTYEKKTGFFGDYAIWIGPPGGEPSGFDEEWAGRSLSAPVLVTVGRRGDVELATVDFAPWTDAPQIRGCFVRILVPRNVGTNATGPLEIRVSAYNATIPAGPDAMVETVGSRSLTTRFLTPGGVAGKGVLSMPVSSLAPGEQRVLLLVHCTSEGLDPMPAPAFDPGKLLDETAARYAEWEGRLTQFDLPDPMVADFLDGMKMTLKVQTAATGAACPMSEYTRTWARDAIGPMLAWMDFGAHDDARALLDYLWVAILHDGDLQNSYDADLDPKAPALPPDWAAMPPLGPRVAAETPSYLVWMYGLSYRYTGEKTRIADRFGLLRRALFAQGFGPDRLLPFTGDETYRAAMNAAFGLDLEYPHHERSWSANSSYVWVGASREFGRMATDTGHLDDAAEAAKIRLEVDASILQHYVLADGCHSPFKDRDTMQAWPAPFEDVALQVTWAGWRDGDDPEVRKSIHCLMDRLRVSPGVVQSPLDVAYQGFPLLDADEGVYTGMLPGYVLAALADAGHPEAADAFRAVRDSLDTSGNLQEYLVFDDRSGLTIVYDPGGGIGDYTAKFRPWEGGIVADAVFRYLLGFRPDAAKRTIALRPHLPKGWPGFEVRGLRVGEDRFDVRVTGASPPEGSIRIRSWTASDYRASLRWDLGNAEGADIDTTGTPDPVLPLTIREHFGVVSVETRPVTVPAGGEVTFVVKRKQDPSERKVTE